MKTETANHPTVSLPKHLPRIFLYLLAGTCGFAGLAVEIIAPRLFASLFGATTSIWAVNLSVALLGYAVGYSLGGRFKYKKTPLVLVIVLCVCALWLLSSSWWVLNLPDSQSGNEILNAGLAAFCAFFIPFLLFGTISPLVITYLLSNGTEGNAARVTGSVYAVSTLGSVFGALMAALLLIPGIGLQSSLQLIAALLILLSLPLLQGLWRLISLALLAVCVLIPQPDYHWQNNLTLLAQAEGTYQTVRVVSDGKTFVRMHLGPTYETEMDLQSQEPHFGYALSMLEIIGNVDGKDVLIIGGAGHTQARSLEFRGAHITEVEIDPLVIELSDRYFGPIVGEVIQQDGRTFVEHAETARYDIIIVDAFNGPASNPPQLTTLEFFQSAKRIMRDEGMLLYNFIGVPEGEKSDSFRAICTTLSYAFEDARASVTYGNTRRNIILTAAKQPLAGVFFPACPSDGFLLTDELNPIELFFENARR